VASIDLALRRVSRAIFYYDVWLKGEVRRGEDRGIAVRVGR
jgi:hypothetical protein